MLKRPTWTIHPSSKLPSEQCAHHLFLLLQSVVHHCETVWKPEHVISSQSHDPSLYQKHHSLLNPSLQTHSSTCSPSKGVQAEAYEAKAQVPATLSPGVYTFLRQGIAANYTVSISQDYMIYIWLFGKGTEIKTTFQHSSLLPPDPVDFIRQSNMQ